MYLHIVGYMSIRKGFLTSPHKIVDDWNEPRDQVGKEKSLKYQVYPYINFSHIFIFLIHTVHFCFYHFLKYILHSVSVVNKIVNDKMSFIKRNL